MKKWDDYKQTEVEMGLFRRYMDKTSVECELCVEILKSADGSYISPRKLRQASTKNASPALRGVRDSLSRNVSIRTISSINKRDILERIKSNTSDLQI